MLAAVAAAVARDKQVQAELAGEARQRFARYASSDSEDEAAAAPNSRQRGGAGGKGGSGGGLAADVARFAGSSDEEGEAGPGGVVEFGGGDGGTAERRAAKRRRREAAAAAGAGGKRPKGAAVSVRPGELVHAGAGAGGSAHRAAGGADGGAGFAALGLSSQLADHLAAHGFQAPTGVQREAIPVLLGRRDALINAPTGSGKTLRCGQAGEGGRRGVGPLGTWSGSLWVPLLHTCETRCGTPTPAPAPCSYLAPIVHNLAAQQPPISRTQGTYAVVICPTRELCLQVADVLTMLVRRFVWLVSALCPERPAAPGWLAGGGAGCRMGGRTLGSGGPLLCRTPGCMLHAHPAPPARPPWQVGGAIHGGEDRGKEKARLRKVGRAALDVPLPVLWWGRLAWGARPPAAGPPSFPRGQA